MMTAKDFEYKQILFLVPKNGEKLAFKNDNVIVKDANDKIIHQSTCYRLFAIFIVGHITITSTLIQKSKKFGFGIVFMTTTFRPYQTISNFAEGNVLLRKKQYSYKSLNGAKELINNKIINQRDLMIKQRNKSDEMVESINYMDNYLAELKYASSVQEIMGIEGNAAKVYFKSYFNNVDWKGRKPRIKFDMINALLDIGYTILFNYVDSLLSVFGFDRYCGILHKQFYMRKSLTCDMVEPFRVIIDKQVKKSINLGQFKEADFEVYDGKWCLKYKCSADYSKIFLEAINQYKDEIFVYIRDFYRSFMKHDLEINFPIWTMR